jgi:hypothetical protein
MVLHDGLREGKIEFWRHDLGRAAFEQLLVSAVGEIEDWKQQCTDKKAFNQSYMNGIVIGAANNFGS